VVEASNPELIRLAQTAWATICSARWWVGNRLTRVDGAVREALDAGESLVAAAAVNDVIPKDGSWPQLFRPHKVLAMTTKRFLLLDYFGMVARHAEIRFACRRESAAGNVTRVFGLRLFHMNRGPGPAQTYRAYLRCAKSADVLRRWLEQETLTDFENEPGELFRVDEPSEPVAPQPSQPRKPVTAATDTSASRMTRARRDRAVESVAVLIAVFGWPSAIGLLVAHKWSHLFNSNIGSDARKAIALMGAMLLALFFGVMGLGPLAEAASGSNRALLALVAVGLAPTITLALLFYR
jgi:hypothetical protein